MEWAKTYLGAEVIHMVPRLSRRFSLRTLFVFVTLVCCAVAAHTTVWRSAQQQKRFVGNTQAAGNGVCYDYEVEANAYQPLHPYIEWYWGDASPEVAPWYPPVPPVSDWLISRLGVDYFCSVTRVSFARGDFAVKCDATPKRLAEVDETNAALLREMVCLQEIDTIELEWTPPNGLNVLKKMRHLKRVTFRDSVDKRHLTHVAKSPATHVELLGDVVDDEQLIALSSSPRLRSTRIGRADNGNSSADNRPLLKSRVSRTVAVQIADYWCVRWSLPGAENAGQSMASLLANTVLSPPCSYAVFRARSSEVAQASRTRDHAQTTG